MDIWKRSMKILTVGCHRLDTLSPCILGRPLQLPNAILPRWKMESPKYSHRHIFAYYELFQLISHLNATDQEKSPCRFLPEFREGHGRQNLGHGMLTECVNRLQERENNILPNLGSLLCSQFKANY